MDIEYVDKHDKEGNRMKFFRYSGYEFPGYYPRDYGTRFDLIRGMEIRQDDIILVEYHKSGKIRITHGITFWCCFNNWCQSFWLLSSYKRNNGLQTA